jgi:hypothetical protein
MPQPNFGGYINHELLIEITVAEQFADPRGDLVAAAADLA